MEGDGHRRRMGGEDGATAGLGDARRPSGTRRRRGRFDRRACPPARQVSCSTPKRVRRFALGGSFEAVARNARENFEQSAGPGGHDAQQRRRYERLKALTEAALADLRDIIADRASARRSPRHARRPSPRSRLLVSGEAARRTTGSWSTASNSTIGFAMPTRSPSLPFWRWS